MRMSVCYSCIVFCTGLLFSRSSSAVFHLELFFDVSVKKIRAVQFLVVYVCLFFFFCVIVVLAVDNYLCRKAFFVLWCIVCTIGEFS